MSDFTNSNKPSREAPLDAQQPAATAPPSAATGTPAAVSSERLIFTVFLALAVHALIILGIGFNVDLGNKPAPTLEITLASHRSQQAPDKADYLAQHNQQASGTADKAQQMTTDQLAPMEDSQIRQVSPTPQIKAAKPTPREALTPVTTISDSLFKLDQQPRTPDQQEDLELLGKDAFDTPLSAEIASLRARLEEQRQAIARRPRIRRITSVATKASIDAEYLAKWTSKVEFVGNRNFPEEAIRRGIVGQLRLATIIRPNGTIEAVEILQSSGYPLLDDAALQIVHLSAPFPPFPAEIRKEVDQLEIIRTWHFELSGLSTTARDNP